MKRVFGILVSVFFLLSSMQITLAAQDKPVIVLDGAPRTVIVIRRNAADPEKYAAQELQEWIGRITDAMIPVITDANVSPAQNKIRIGTDFAKPFFQDDLRKIGKSDGYAIRCKRNDNAGFDIYLFGANERGTLHSVYSFLENNTDIIWARPDPVYGTVFSKIKTFTVNAADILDIPKSRIRGWQWNYSRPDGNIEEWEWESRNRLNRLTYAPAYFAPMYITAGGGHGIQLFINAKKYQDSHPEYYPFIKGKRSAASGQICLTAYEMIPEYVKNIREYLREKFPGVKDDKLHVDFLNLSIADNWVVCECPKCLEPLHTESGITVQPDSQVFRSAQYYAFINRAAKELKKTHPHVTVGVYAYIFTSEPPPFKLEDNIRVQYCPFVQNEKKPIYDENTNGKWRKYLDEWGARADNAFFREYVGLANKFPRAQAYRIRDNGLYCLKQNVLEYSSEHPIDCELKNHPGLKQNWDASAMCAWVISRLWWNAEQDLEGLRKMYISRTYREAAEPMTEYYDLLRDSFYSDDMPSFYSDGVSALVSHYIVQKGLSDKLLSLLKKAEKLAVHPVSKQIIERHISQFQYWMDITKNDKTVRMNVPCCGAADILHSFDSPIWDKAGKTEDFVVADKGENHGKKAKFRSTAQILHDKKYIYIKYDCFAPDMDTLKASEKTISQTEASPRGDIMEFFLGHSNGIYYQFMMDMGNEDDHSKDCVYDGKVYDSSWTCPWKRACKRYSDRWTAIVQIPLEDIGVNITQNNKLLFQAIRGKYYSAVKDGKTVRVREMASWNGGWVHQMQAFGELTLLQN